jgi:chromosomal replication initiation ATPase DnaA
MTDEGNIWDEVMARLRQAIEGDDFRRWFAGTSYASDSGDQVVVWVPTEPVRRHLMTHFQDQIDRTLSALGRRHTHIRFVVAGVSDDEDES